jgi:uncharacterized DUF497 family protein
LRPVCVRRYRGQFKSSLGKDLTTENTENAEFHRVFSLFSVPEVSSKVVGEDLYSSLGQTDAGRYLKVLFIYKRNKDALVITTFDMDRKERRKYART